MILIASKVGYGGICLTKTDRKRNNITSVGEGLGPPEASNFTFPREEQAPPLPAKWVITPINRSIKIPIGASLCAPVLRAWIYFIGVALALLRARGEEGSRHKRRVVGAGSRRRRAILSCPSYSFAQPEKQAKI